MVGLAERLFRGDESPKDYLMQLVDDGVFEKVDYYFAHTVAKREEERYFVAAMMAFARNGHLCLEIGKKLQPSVEDLKGGYEGIKDLERLIRRGATEISDVIVKRGQRYYLQRNWFLETRVVEAIKTLWRREVKLLDNSDVQGLNKGQKKAVIATGKSVLLFLSGGPGTGKTYTIERIVHNYLANETGKVLLAAPTGKAAAELKRRLLKGRQEHEGRIHIGTLHSLLQIKKASDLVWKKSHLQGGLLLVDECSMLDVALWGALLQAIPQDMRVVFVGDHEQLPPIETGTIFTDLCLYTKKYQREGYVHLEECLRTNQQGIMTWVESVKKGQGFPEHKCLSEIQVEWQKWQKMFPNPQKKDPDLQDAFKKMSFFRILSCLRKGPWGVETVNEKIKELFLQDRKKGEVWPIPIILTQTSYHLGLYNGEMGVLLKRSFASYLEKEDEAIFIEATGNFRHFPAMILPAFEYGYCLSVHKSQGSEYEKVVFLIPPGSEIFGREILYTGITRARKQLEVFGERGVIEKCCKKSSQRNSGIFDRLKE